MPKKDEDGMMAYTYSDLYDLIAGEYVEETFLMEFSLTPGNIIGVDRVWGYFQDVPFADIFHVYGANNVNWMIDRYVGRLVSGSTVAYYEFANMGKLLGIAPDLKIITLGEQVTVSTDLADLKRDAEIIFTMVNGVPTGYAIQY